MDLAGFTALASPAGQDALAQAMELAPDQASFLSCHNRLSKRFGPDLARAALETALLRRRAAVKFRLAGRMFFTREALEQASSEPVSHHRACRFAGLGTVADLCCGIGGDAITLAGVAPVVAADFDPLRLRMAERNLEAYGLAGRVRFIEGDVLRIDLPGMAAAFVDPDRRVEGRRVLSVDDCRPPLSALRARLGRDLPLAVKLAPGIPS